MWKFLRIRMSRFWTAPQGAGPKSQTKKKKEKKKTDSHCCHCSCDGSCILYCIQAITSNSRSHPSGSPAATTAATAAALAGAPVLASKEEIRAVRHGVDMTCGDSPPRSLWGPGGEERKGKKKNHLYIHVSTYICLLMFTFPYKKCISMNFPILLNSFHVFVIN